MNQGPGVILSYVMGQYYCKTLVPPLYLCFSLVVNFMGYTRQLAAEASNSSALLDTLLQVCTSSANIAQ